MARIKDMLKEEIHKSSEFQRNNFGLQMGDGYPDMVRELTHSSSVQALLIIGLQYAVSGAPRFLLTEHSGDPDVLQQQLLDNLPAFSGPLQMFYWGMQIGRRLQQEEDAVMKKMTEQVMVTCDHTSDWHKEHKPCSICGATHYDPDAKGQGL